MNVLNTPTLYRLPVEHLFKSIYILDLADELVRESDLLKQRMEEYFTQVKDKNGFKAYGDIRYYPNGLCESGSLSIVLSPWQSQSIPIEATQESILRAKIQKDENAKPKKIHKPKTCYKALEQINQFWCFQVKEMTKVSYNVDKLRIERPFAETYVLYNKLKKLKGNAKDILQEELWALQKSASDILKMLFGERRLGCFQTDEVAEQLLKLARISPTDVGGTYVAIKDYVRTLRVNEEHNYFKNKAYGSTKTHAEYCDALMHEFHGWLQSIDNPNVLRVLKKLNIIA